MHGLSDDKKIASLWGGVVRNMRYGNRRSNVEPNVLAVLITGSIQTWSVVVDEKCETRAYEQVEKKFKLLKKQVKLQKYSLGFIFACTEYPLVNRVRSLLITIFPKLNNVLDLVPNFRHMEFKTGFGKDTIVDEEKFKNVPDQLLRHDSTVMPSYTSNVPLISIMILTYS